jgi:hypothetical protein
MQAPVTYYTADEVAVVPSARPGTTAGWRRPLAIVLLVAGCLTTPAALASAYVHTDIMDVDGYVDTVTPIADDAAIQKAVADALATQVSGALDANSALPGPLPEELGAFTGPLGSQLEGLTGELTLKAVASPAFRGFWAEANRKVHPVLVAAIEGKGKLKVATRDLIGLDLAGVTTEVTDLLAASGVTLPDTLPKALTTGDVAMLDARPFSSAGGAIRALDRLFPALPLAAVALLIASVLVASSRLRTLAWMGAGLALAMAALQTGLLVGRGRYLDATDEAGIPHDASAAIWGAITRDLSHWGWAVLIVGAALAAAAALGRQVVGGGGKPQPPRPSYVDYLYLPGEGRDAAGSGLPGGPPPRERRYDGLTGPPPRR